MESETVAIEAPEWRSEVPVPKGSCSYSVREEYERKPDFHITRDNLPDFAWPVPQAGAGEIRVTDPVTGGQKGSKPERYDLIPFEGLDEVARVYAYGANKYADHNWRRGYRWSLSSAAALRHISRWMQGEDRDDESGLHHLAHAAFHMLTLITYDALNKGTDDRP